MGRGTNTLDSLVWAENANMRHDTHTYTHTQSIIRLRDIMGRDIGYENIIGHKT